MVLVLLPTYILNLLLLKNSCIYHAMLTPLTEEECDDFTADFPPKSSLIYIILRTPNIPTILLNIFANNLDQDYKSF